jgi:hypothetical protein
MIICRVIKAVVWGTRVSLDITPSKWAPGIAFTQGTLRFRVAGY